MTRVAQVIVALAAGIFAASCKADECEPGTIRCDGNVAETCYFQWDNELSGHTVLHQENCGTKHCQVPPTGVSAPAFCALDDFVDPRSPEQFRDKQRALRCNGEEIVTWTFGYRVSTEPCSSDQRCADVTRSDFDPACDGVAFCTPLGAADPLCADPGVATSCENETTIVYCSCRYRLSAHACASPGPSCLHMAPAPGVPVQGVCR